MARVLQSPAPLVWDAARECAIFLAGSIEQGTAPDWQSALSHALHDVDAVLLNPRREHWDPHAPASVIEEQVNWELEALERADLIAMYFVPGTLSPITLLELGLHARSGRLVVCCPHGYWRKGNVDIVCGRYGVATVESLQALALTLKSRVVARREG